MDATNLDVVKVGGRLGNHRDEDDSDPVREAGSFSLSHDHSSLHYFCKMKTLNTNTLTCQMIESALSNVNFITYTFCCFNYFTILQHNNY